MAFCILCICTYALKLFSSILYYSSSLVEPRDGETSVATFTVERSRGTFTDVMVTWEVVGGGADLQPTAGVVSFSEGQSTGSFEINILPDNVS